MSSLQDELRWVKQQLASEREQFKAERLHLERLGAATGAEMGAAVARLQQQLSSTRSDAAAALSRLREEAAAATATASAERTRAQQEAASARGELSAERMHSEMLASKLDSAQAKLADAEAAVRALQTRSASSDGDGENASELRAELAR
eukprot:4194745-Pleurochrysis_carterae.AAC.1